MDIRTKLIIVLVLVSIASMAALGVFAYDAAAVMLKQISERQLNALSESKAQDVRKLISSWHDRVSLVASRTQLRINLDQYNKRANTQPNEGLVNAMQRILNDAQQSTPSVLSIALFDRSGKILVIAGEDIEPVREVRPGLARDEGIRYRGLDTNNDRTFVTFTAPLTLQQATIGGIAVAIDAEDVATVTGDYTGLGELGETIIVVRESASSSRVLHTLRHSDQRVFTNQLLHTAASGTQATFMEDHKDYRNISVWAASRYIEPLDWGLVVQLDRDEELERTRNLEEMMLNLGLALSAFAILGGVIVGVILARPIRELAATVNRIRAGETSLRAQVRTEDEVGELARALNEFLDDDQNQ